MTVINEPSTFVNKRYMVKSWFDLWSGMADREAISVKALSEAMENSGFPTRMVYDEDEEAFLMMVDTAGGTYEISPAYMVSIGDKDIMVSFVNEMHVYRKDGSALTNGMHSKTETEILRVIDECR